MATLDCPAVAAEDGPLEYRGAFAGTWANACAASGGSFFSVGSSTDSYYLASADNAVGVFLTQLVDRGFLSFDLSSLPAGSTVTGVVLHVKGYDVASGAGGSLKLYDGTQGAALTTGDWAAYGSTELMTAVNFSSLSGSGWNDLTLNSSGVAAVQAAFDAASHVQFCARSSFDVSGTGPASDTRSYLAIRYADYATSGDRPYITVTYTTPTVGRSLDQPYNVQNTVGRSCGQPYTVKNAVGRSLDQPYGLAGAVGRSLTQPFGMSAAVGRSLTQGYIVIKAPVGHSLDQPYLVYHYKTGTRTASGSPVTLVNAGSNPSGGPATGWNGFPSMVRLPDPTTPFGRTIVAWWQGGGQRTDYRDTSSGANGDANALPWWWNGAKTIESLDLATTFDSPQDLLDPFEVDPDDNSQGDTLSRLAIDPVNGDVMHVWYHNTYEGPIPGPGPYGSSYDGSLNKCHSYFRRSSDQLATWSTPVRLDESSGFTDAPDTVTAVHSVLPLRNGRILCSLYGSDKLPYAAATADGCVYTRILYSDDRGATWSYLGTPFPKGYNYDGRANPYELLCAEVSLVELDTGRILALARVQNAHGASYGAYWTNYSDDGGATWATPAYAFSATNLTAMRQTVAGDVIAAGAYGGGVGVFQSKDRGGSWTHCFTQSLPAGAGVGADFIEVTGKDAEDNLLLVYGEEQWTYNIFEGGTVANQGWIKFQRLSSAVTPAPTSIAGSIGRSLDQPYSVIQSVGRSLDQRYVVTSAVGRSLAQPYAMSSSIGRSLTQPYAVSGGIGRSLTQPYGMGGVAGRSLSQPFSVVPATGRSLTQPYAVLMSVGRSCAQPYSLVPTTASFHMNMQLPPGTVVGAYRRSEWIGSEVPQRGAGSYPGAVVASATVDAYGEVTFTLPLGSYIAWTADFPLRRRFFVVTSD